MIRSVVLALSILAGATCVVAQTAARPVSTDKDFKLALPHHPGQLQWQAPGFKIVESSAKPNLQEIGIRAADESKQVFFLAFLFLNKDAAPMTARKCQDSVLAEDTKDNPSLKILTRSEIPRSDGMPIALVSYVTHGRDGKDWYGARAFVATADTCGDLEFYSQKPISADEPAIHATFESYRFASDYVPDWKDKLVYAQVLYQQQMYKAAGPVFEEVLAGLPSGESQRTMVRVVTDQAGMSYGIAGGHCKITSHFRSSYRERP